MKIIEGWKAASNGQKLLVDLTLRPWGDQLMYRCNEQLTDKPVSEIISMGYRECEGWKDGLAFYRMPIYVKFHNFKKCDYKKGFIDKWGEPTDSMHGFP